MTSLAGLQIAEWDHLKWKQIPKNMSNCNSEHLNAESLNKNCCMAVPDDWNPVSEKALSPIRKQDLGVLSSGNHPPSCI